MLIVNIELVQELIHWWLYIAQNIRIHCGIHMIEVILSNNTSGWISLDCVFPQNLVDEHGQILEPLLSELALWIVRKGKEIAKNSQMTIDMTFPLGIREILAN